MSCLTCVCQEVRLDVGIRDSLVRSSRQIGRVTALVDGPFATRMLAGEEYAWGMDDQRKRPGERGAVPASATRRSSAETSQDEPEFFL